MKQLKYILLAFVCCLFTGCMDDGYDEPQGIPYGNNDIEETNVISIADLKTRYASVLSQAYAVQEITEELQLKARVTANDISGNIYNQVALEDGTGGMIVRIKQGGLYSYLAVGQEILINLKGLCIGVYGSQPQIGTVYTDSQGRVSPGTINPNVWQTCFKLIGMPDATKVQPVEFDLSKLSDNAYAKEMAGRLMVVKDVRLSDADGVKTFAPEDEGADTGGGVNRMINNLSDLVLRTSTYADFAAQVMPQGTVDITGVFTIYNSNPSRYSNTWQIVMRSDKDLIKK